MLVAGGPSLTAPDVAHCRGRARVLAVNDAWRLAPWADLLYAADGAWWRAHRGVPGFAGQRVTQNHGSDDVKAAREFGIPMVNVAIKAGLSDTPGLLHSGHNSGHQALDLAVQLGASRILLLGYDMQPRADGVRHWFGEHPAGLNRTDPNTFALWRVAFAQAAEDCRRRGVEVINCSRVTALDCFPRLPIEQALPA